MDKKQFDAIADQLLDKHYKNQNTRKTIAGRIKRGKQVKINEESLIVVAKPQLRPCEDCSIISTNSKKLIYKEFTAKGHRWIKRCEECGKRTILSQSTITDAK